ncbi:MAG: ATP-binding cassette domain-containing protein [Chloroflexi bacterium]|nr:ATP-binding cassette domain-containing protein [Chloroflexota bacterium]
MITLKGVSKSFGNGGNAVHALHEVDLEVGRGEIFGVVGASGAGKSTLIRCVNLLEKPDKGSVEVDGQVMTTLGDAELRKARQRIGMIFQLFNLLSSRTAAQNVAFPLEIQKMEKPLREKRVEELLEMVGLTDKAGSYPAQLSGGQKQRVGIARALATNPSVLLCDEATSALDPANTRAILTLLKDLNQRLGLTILLITHEMEVVRQICDHVAILEEGRVVEQGAISDLIANPTSRLSQAFFPPILDSQPAEGSVWAAITFLGGSADEPVLTNLVRKFDVEVNILGGSIQTIGGQRVGQLQVELKGEQTQEAVEHLRELNLRVEVR